MKSAVELQHDVLEELKWDPSLRESTIGTSTQAGEEGIVTLTGQVRSFTQRQAAEEAARRVRGVRGVVNDLFVKLPLSMQPDDGAIEQVAVRALKESPTLSDEQLRVSVAEGWLTLEGAVERVSQKEAAYQAVRDLWGVRGVTHRITVRRQVQSCASQRKIRPARRRRILISRSRAVQRGRR